jgi:hypothetical protein
MRTQWEYRVVTVAVRPEREVVVEAGGEDRPPGALVEHLNDWGREGWELQGVLRCPASPSGPEEALYKLVLKRPVEARRLRLFDPPPARPSDRG